MLLKTFCVESNADEEISFLFVFLFPLSFWSISSSIGGNDELMFNISFCWWSQSLSQIPELKLIYYLDKDFSVSPFKFYFSKRPDHATQQ